MVLIAHAQVQDRYDAVIAGSGFGSLFFLHGLLQRQPRARCLIVEWGAFRDHGWQLANQRNTDIDCATTFRTRAGEKPWNFTIGFGGGTNCWWAQTPRLTPSDFRLRSTYGVGDDWPISYDDLEPYYVAAEQIMLIAGDDRIGKVHPRSAPYPQPPHALSSIDLIMQAAMPDHHFAAPTARLSRAVGRRGACCSTASCDICPVEAKATVWNTFERLIAAENVHILPNARVTSVDVSANSARALVYEVDGRVHAARGDIVVVGCNAVHSPFILMRSGLSHPALGAYLHEKRVLKFEVLLDGLDNFDGGNPRPALNMAWADGEHRRDCGGAIVYFVNDFQVNGLRTEWGRWRQTLPLEAFVEDIPLEENRIVDDGGDTPIVHHAKRSQYCDRGAARVHARLPELLRPLPVEWIVFNGEAATGSHIQGTCRMGSDPDSSIVDGGLVHHRVRNLVVVGTSVWPSCSTANPSLTAAALSLRAAAML